MFHSRDPTGKKLTNVKIYRISIIISADYYSQIKKEIISPDIVYLAPGILPIEGKDSLRKFITPIYEIVSPAIEMIPEDIKVLNKVAYGAPAVRVVPFFGSRLYQLSPVLNPNLPCFI